MLRLKTRSKHRTRWDANGAAPAAAEVFSTELGWMAVAHCEGVLCGLVFGHRSVSSATQALRRMLGADTAMVDNVREGEQPAGSIGGLVGRLRRFAAGEPVDFRDVPIDERHLTPFGRRVVAACRRIRLGQTRTYGRLAAVCGAPGAARAVGQVMARNRYPLVVPCHRVVAACGVLGGFSAPQGLAMKRRLLALESRTLGVLASS